MTSHVQRLEPVSQASILGWIEELGEAVKSAEFAPLLDFDGVDALDVLLSPVYLSVLNAMRNGPVRQPSGVRTLLGQARNWAYRAKVAARDRFAARISAHPEPADILLWSRHVTHTVIFDPVARALRQQHASCRLIACQATIFAGLATRDPSAVFTRAAWPSVLRRAHRDGARRARRLARFGRWKVPPFSRDSAADFEPAVRATVTRLLPLMSEAIVNARMAIETFGAKLLVVGNDLTFEGRAGCRVAAQRKVPTALFMHGSISGDALQSLHCADRVLVYGNIQREQLAQRGIARERIVVCGAPNLDNRPRQSGHVHPSLQAGLVLAEGDAWILVATSGPGHRISHAHHQTVIQHLARLSTALPHVKVVVKLHPKDRLEYYPQVLKDGLPKNLVIVAENAQGFPRDIFEWLQGCPAVLTGASAVAVEAMLMDVPVITMDFRDEIDGVDFIDAGATTHVRTPTALVEAVSRILAGGAPQTDTRSRVQAYLADAFCALDGCSASRGASSLLEMIDRSSR